MAFRVARVLRTAVQDMPPPGGYPTVIFDSVTVWRGCKLSGCSFASHSEGANRAEGNTPWTLRRGDLGRVYPCHQFWLLPGKDFTFTLTLSFVDAVLLFVVSVVQGDSSDFVFLAVCCSNLLRFIFSSCSQVGQTNIASRKERQETREARYAIAPLLQAEEDLRYVERRRAGGIAPNVYKTPGLWIPSTVQ